MHDQSYIYFIIFNGIVPYVYNIYIYIYIYIYNTVRALFSGFSDLRENC